MVFFLRCIPCSLMALEFTKMFLRLGGLMVFLERKLFNRRDFLDFKKISVVCRMGCGTVGGFGCSFFC